MEIMMMLDGSALNQLRDEFRNRPTKHPDGFSVDEFVNLMLEKLPPFKDRTQFTKDLCELFAQIDVNGDGTMEWEEFTSYCVEAGIVATRRIMEPLKHKFVEHAHFVDRNSRGPCIWNVLYAPQLKNLFVFEAEATKVKVYTPKLELVREITMPPADVKPMVHNGVYIPEHKLLAVCSSDFSLTFWDAADKFRFVGSGFSRTSQNGLCWDGSKLYTWGSNTVISMWDIKKRIIVKKFTRHTDIVLSMVAVPEHELVLSGGMDKTIYLWQLGTSVCKGQLTGHARGVKQMIYMAEIDLLLSCGFECDAYGWDLSNKRQVMRLRGHRFPLVGIQPLRRFGVFEPRALTGDRGGNFKVWDVSKTHTGLAVCLQTFTTSSHLSKFTPRAFTTLPPSGSMVAAGLKLHMFVSRPVVAGEVVSTDALWNPVTRHFVTVAERNATLWTPEGRKQQDFFSLAESTITALTVDDRQRKLVLGTQGGCITVYNFVNGAVMKTANAKHASDVTALKYVDVDKIVVSTSWDRQVRVYDENDPDTLALLRHVEHAHHADITCVDASRDLSLIVSGAADSTVHLWSFLHLKLVAQLKGHHAEVTAVMFVDPYPLLITADCAGFIMFWGTRGGDIHLVHQCLHVLKNHSAAPSVTAPTFMTESEAPLVAVSGLSLGTDAESGHLLLFVADEIGWVHSHDLTELVNTIGLEPVPEHKKRTSRMNYNPHVRVKRIGPAAPRRRSSAASRRRTSSVKRRVSSRTDITGAGGASVVGARHRGSPTSSMGTPKVFTSTPKVGGLNTPASGSSFGFGTGTPKVFTATPKGFGFGGTPKAFSPITRRSVGGSTPGAGKSPARRPSLSGSAAASTPQRGASSGGLAAAANTSPNARIRALSPVPEHDKPGAPRVDTRRRASFGGAGGGGVVDPAADASSVASFTSDTAQSQATLASTPLPRIAPAARCLKALPRVASWAAHKDAIVTIRASTDPHAIVTCSHDKSVRVWSYHGECLGVLLMGKAERAKVRRGDLPRTPWRFAPDAAAREQAALAAAHNVLATIQDDKQRELDRIADAAEREKQAQWLEEQVRAGRMTSSSPLLRPSSHARSRKVSVRTTKSPKHRRSSSKQGAQGSTSTLVSPIANSVHLNASTTSGLGGAMRLSVLQQLHDSDDESSDDDIVVEDDLSDPAGSSDDEREAGTVSQETRALALAAAIASGERKPLEEKYSSLVKEQARHQFTNPLTVAVDTTPSSFLVTHLGAEASVDRSSARRRSRASSTGGRSPGGFGAGGRKGRKHMQLSLQSAPVSRGSSPRGQLDDLDGRSAVSPSQVATRLEQRSWELQGDSFVEDGYGHQRGHGRPHTTPLPLSSSRHEVLQRLYTADKTRRSPRLERSFSQREQMEAAQRSLRQHMEGDRLIAKIDAILGHSRSTSELPTSTGSKPVLTISRSSPRFTSISELLANARSKTSSGAASPASSFTVGTGGALTRGGGAQRLTVAERAMLKLQEALKDDDSRAPPSGRRPSNASRHSASSGRSGRSAHQPMKAGNGRAVMFGSYSEKDVREIKALFDAFDVDGSGTIDASEFQLSSAWRQSKLPNIASSLFDSLDKDGSGELTLDELVKVVFPYASDREVSGMVAFAHRKDGVRTERAPVPLTKEQEAEFKAIFTTFDIHGTGEISQDELYHLMSPNWGDILTPQDLMNMCRDIGLKPTDPITEDDFVRLLHTQS